MEVPSRVVGDGRSEAGSVGFDVSQSFRFSLCDLVTCSFAASSAHNCGSFFFSPLCVTSTEDCAIGSRQCPDDDSLALGEI